MTSFRTRHATVEAAQWSGSNEQELMAMVGAVRVFPQPDLSLDVELHDGRIVCVDQGSWLVKYADGNVRVNGDKYFQKTYEPA